MATFVLEDLEKAVEAFVFPKVMAACGQLLEDDAVVVVRGRLDTREDTPRLVVLDLSRPVLANRDQHPLRVQVPLAVLSDENVARLRAVLESHPGSVPVLLHVGAKVLRLPPELGVEVRNGLLGELVELFGPAAILPEGQPDSTPEAGGWAERAAVS